MTPAAIAAIAATSGAAGAIIGVVTRRAEVVFWRMRAHQQLRRLQRDRALEREVATLMQRRKGCAQERPPPG